METTPSPNFVPNTKLQSRVRNEVLAGISQENFTVGMGLSGGWGSPRSNLMSRPWDLSGPLVWFPARSGLPPPRVFVIHLCAALTGFEIEELFSDFHIDGR